MGLTSLKLPHSKSLVGTVLQPSSDEKVDALTGETEASLMFKIYRAIHATDCKDCDDIFSVFSTIV